MSEPEASPERSGGGFLSRWSERKLALRDGATIIDDSPTEEVARQQAPIATDDPMPDAQPAEAPTDADMPPLEDLDADSDYSGFLSEGVSEALRNQALKKLFFSGPFNVVDGLDDYADDFTQFAALGDIVTAEMRHRIEEAAKRVAEAGEGLADTGTEAAEASDTTLAESGEEPAVSTTTPDAEGQEEL